MICLSLNAGRFKKGLELRIVSQISAERCRAELVQMKAAGDFAIWLSAKPLSERSEEHTSELQSLMRISYAVFCLKQKKQTTQQQRSTERNNIAPYLHREQY